MVAYYTISMPTPCKRLYCYVDESGQDTAGDFFVVSILVTGDERDALLKQLLEIERQSKKRNIKWHKANYRYRLAYIDLLTKLPILEGKIFYEIYDEGKDYLAYTSDATAKTLRHKRADAFTIYIDGYREAELTNFKRHLRPSVKVPTQIRGVKRDENNVFIRLVDAICGLVRDAQEDDKQAKEAVKKLKHKGIVQQA